MSKIPPHIVDEVMQTARIEEVIGEFVNLKRAGSSMKGLSPFTDEKTPSFVVSPAKQIFKCFSTGKGGTVVTFIMEKEHFSFPEAIRWLADKYGIQIPEDAPESAEQIAATTERESLFIINEFDDGLRFLFLSKKFSNISILGVKLFSSLKLFIK